MLDDICLPSDNHVHTQWSWDAPAEASMALSCEQALAAGIPAVAFTDHLDFTGWIDGDQIAVEGLAPRPYYRMRLLDLPGYLEGIDECRRRYPDLRILSGVEIGEAHLWGASAAAVLASADLGRVLGSLHAIPFEGRLTAADQLFPRMPADEVMRRYFAELLRLVEGSGLFEVLAHIDFPRRMWPSRAGAYDETAFEAEYRAVLQALADSGRVLEVNTKSPLASVGLIRWWREAGGRAVSFGSDAHQPWRVGDRFKLAVDVVEAAGFRAGRDRFDFWRLLEPCSGVAEPAADPDARAPEEIRVVAAGRLSGPGVGDAGSHLVPGPVVIAGCLVGRAVDGVTELCVVGLAVAELGACLGVRRAAGTGRSGREPGAFALGI